MRRPHHPLVPPRGQLVIFKRGLVSQRQSHGLVNICMYPEHMVENLIQCHSGNILEPVNENFT